MTVPSMVASPPYLHPMAIHRSYAASHKGLRNILGQFSLLAGRTDYGSPADVQRLKALGDEMFMLLTHHLHTENDHLLALLEQRVPGALQHNLRDHEELEVIQQDVADRLARLDGTQTALEGHAFHLAFTAFQGRYLGHIHHEEVVTEELLLKHFTEAELIANSERIVQQVEFPVLLASRQGASKNLERMARAAIVRPDEALRRADTGTMYPTEEQRSMGE